MLDQVLLVLGSVLLVDWCARACYHRDLHVILKNRSGQSEDEEEPAGQLRSAGGSDSFKRGRGNIVLTNRSPLFVLLVEHLHPDFSTFKDLLDPQLNGQKC